MRPNSPSPWVAEDKISNDVTVRLTDTPDEPTYVESVSIPTALNVESVTIKLFNTPEGGEEEIVFVKEVPVSRSCQNNANL